MFLWLIFLDVQYLTETESKNLLIFSIQSCKLTSEVPKQEGGHTVTSLGPCTFRPFNSFSLRFLDKEQKTVKSIRFPFLNISNGQTVWIPTYPFVYFHSFFHRNNCLCPWKTPRCQKNLLRKSKHNFFLGQIQDMVKLELRARSVTIQNIDYFFEM